MALHAFVKKEVYIRLEDDTTLVCTTQYGVFRTTVKKFSVKPLPSISRDEELALVRVRSQFQMPDSHRQQSH